MARLIDWEAHYRKQKTSGQTIKDYCKAQHIAVAGWYKNKAKRERRDNAAFVPVTIKSAPNPQGVTILNLELSGDGGVTFTVQASDRVVLAKLLGIAT